MSEHVDGCRCDDCVYEELCALKDQVKEQNAEIVALQSSNEELRRVLGMFVGYIESRFRGIKTRQAEHWRRHSEEARAILDGTEGEK